MPGGQSDDIQDRDTWAGGRGRTHRRKQGWAGNSTPGTRGTPVGENSKLRSNFLPEPFLEELGKRKDDIGREGMVLLAKSEKKPAMFEDIEDCAEIPEGRDDECDLLGNSLELLVKRGGVFDVLDRVRAEAILELIRRERKLVDAVDHDEVGDLGVLHDIDIDSAPVCLATTDIEIPFLLSVSDDSTHDAVTQEVEGRKKDNKNGGYDQQIKEHIGGSELINNPETSALATN
jgi:hypothetical protein